MLTYIQ